MSKTAARSKFVSHYSPQQYSNYRLPVDPVELEKAMSQARQSYLAWKEIQTKLKEKIN